MHTATLLPNGKVLIAGGCFGNGGPGQSTAELYDPATATFSATGSMADARCNHTATLLNSGQVLIAGGHSRDGASQSAELYDPSTGVFTSTGDMTEPGADTATLLANGKVLITRSVTDFLEDHADLYDPATGTFRRTADFVDISTPKQALPARPGVQPTATLIHDGRVLVAGGSWSDFGGSTLAEVYDPSTGAFSPTGNITTDIDAWASAKLLPEGTVLIAGRSYDIPCGNVTIGPPYTNTCPGAAVLYDPGTGTFGPPMDEQSEEGHAATLLADGTVLISGGWVCCGVTIGTAQIYRPGKTIASASLLSTSGDGTGQGAIQHADTYQLVSAEKPAVAGEIVAIYSTGLINGSVIPPQISIGGRAAEVLWFGNVLRYPGLNQINVRVPNGVVQDLAAPVRMNYIGRPTNEVTMAIAAK
jgi:hypothetical protein